MPKHEMQHPDYPTWCIHCGTFDIYCGASECTSDRSGKWDSRRAENYVRMADELLGIKLAVSE